MQETNRTSRCTECGARLPADAAICPDCGHALTNRRLSEHCPACGARMLAAEDDCPICGAHHLFPALQHRAGWWPALAAGLALAAFAGAVWLSQPWAQAQVIPSPTLRIVPTDTPTPTGTPTGTPTYMLTLTPLPEAVAEPSQTEAVETPTAEVTETEAPTLTATPSIQVHVVAEGETAGRIAARYGVTTDELLQANDLTTRSLLSIGQELRIPGTEPPPATEPAATDASVADTPVPQQTIVHVVASGDTLSGIAVQYEVASAAIAQANGIDLTTMLSIGQEIVIPVGSPAATATPTATPSPTPTQEPPTPTAQPATPTPTAVGTAVASTPTSTPEEAKPVVHVVVSGDTLSGIAVEYGVSSQEIAAANNLSLNTLLRLGQELTIPGTVAVPTAGATLPPEPTPTTTVRPSPTAPPTPSVRYPYQRPHLLAPTNGLVIKGEDTRVLLNWSSVGILGEQEWYLLKVWRPEDVTNKQEIWTKATSWRLPLTQYPDDEGSHRFVWQVSVAKQSGGGLVVPLSATSETYDFYWR
ncbi:MAG: LysM peptidoglycan-binding domain-containing protein [Anaerolineae bacterium]